MKKQSISDQEVIALNSMANEYHEKLKKGEDDRKLFECIKKKSEIIAYTIPYHYFFLPREDCAEFYLYFKPLIESTIMEYRIVLGAITYFSFLVQRIKFKVKSLKYRKRKIEKITNFITTNEELSEKERGYSVDKIPVTAYETRNQQIDMVKLGKEPTLSRLLDKVSSIPHNYKIEYSPEKKELLHRQLTTKRNRTNFLLYLLTMIDSIDPQTQIHLADVFDCDAVYFAEISRWIHNHGRNCYLKQLDERRQTTGKIWAQFVRLEKSLDKEDSPEKKRELEFQKKRCKERLEKLRIKYSRHRTGLSYREIARETGFSLSKIAYTIKGQRKIFENIEKAE